MKREKALGWVIGIVAVVASVVVFLVPFAFILVTAAKTAPEAANLDFTWPTQWMLWDNIQTVLATRNFVVLRAFINSTTFDRVQCGHLGGGLSHGRLRPAAPTVALESADQLPGARRTDRAASTGADHLGAAEHRAVQADLRHDLGECGLEHGLLRPVVPRVRGVHSQRSWTRRRSWTALAPGMTSGAVKG
jgi:hypothetical protein